MKGRSILTVFLVLIAIFCFVVTTYAAMLPLPATETSAPQASPLHGNAMLSQSSGFTTQESETVSHIRNAITQGAWRSMKVGNVEINDYFQFYPDGTVRCYTDRLWLGLQIIDGVPDDGQFIYYDLDEYRVYNYTITEGGLITVWWPGAYSTGPGVFRLREGTSHTDSRIVLADNESLWPYVGVDALYHDHDQGILPQQVDTADASDAALIAYFDLHFGIDNRDNPEIICYRADITRDGEPDLIIVDYRGYDYNNESEAMGETTGDPLKLIIVSISDAGAAELIYEDTVHRNVARSYPNTFLMENNGEYSLLYFGNATSQISHHLTLLEYYVDQTGAEVEAWAKRENPEHSISREGYNEINASFKQELLTRNLFFLFHGEPATIARDSYENGFVKNVYVNSPNFLEAARHTLEDAFDLNGSGASDLTQTVSELHEVTDYYVNSPYMNSASQQVLHAVEAQLSARGKTDIAVSVKEQSAPAVQANGTTYVGQYQVTLSRADASKTIDMTYTQGKHDPVLDEAISVLANVQSTYVNTPYINSAASQVEALVEAQLSALEESDIIVSVTERSEPTKQADGTTYVGRYEVSLMRTDYHLIKELTYTQTLAASATGQTTVPPSDDVSSQDADSPDTKVDNIEDNAVHPVIFIPSFMGSQLYSANDDLYWPASSLNAKATEPDLDFQDAPQLAVKDVFTDQTEQDSASREYGPWERYKPIIDHLCDASEDERPVYYFSYDWRQSPLESAGMLNELVSYIAESLNLADSADAFDMIDIVAHGTGGLIASAFMKMYKDANALQIRKIITAGTPFEGTPAMLNSLISSDSRRVSVESNQVQGADLPADYFLNLFANMRRDVKLGFPSVSLLLPSIEYVSVYPFPANDQGIWDDSNLDQLDEDTYALFLQAVFDQSTDVLDIQHWLKRDGSGVSLTHEGQPIHYLATLPNTYFIVGEGNQTTESFTIERKILSGMKFESGPDSKIVDEGSKTHGDGIVPFESATMLGALPGILGEGSDRLTYLETDHQGTINSADSFAWIDDVLRND